MQKTFCKAFRLAAAAAIALSSCKAAPKERAFFMCDFLPKGEASGGKEATTSGYFDRRFSYTKEGESFEAHFSFSGQAFPTGVKDGALFRAHLKETGERTGFYREIFDIFQFHLKDRILTHSYLYYVSPADFEKNFNNSLFVPYNKPELFELAPRPPPKGYVKIAWDKSVWKCHPATRLKFYIKDLKSLFFKILSG